MPDLRPLRPVRYAAAPGADLSTKVAPPYDVLDEGPKRALLGRDPHNIVAVDLPVTPPKTVGPDEAYAAAGELYRRWLSEGVLQRDDEPCVLVYEQVYDVDGRTRRRRGLICGLGLEGFNRPGGGIFRHEMTIAGGIGDRTKLMEATRAQLSPIFGVFSDPQKDVVDIVNGVAEAGDPHFTATTENDGVEHRCWWVTDPGTLDTLRERFRGTDVFIADGHHRYTTALQFMKDHGAELPGADACLFVLVAAEDEGMIVLPTHRVVCGLRGYTFDKLRATLEADERFTLTDDAAGARFGLYDPASGATVGLNTVDDPLADEMPGKPAVWRALDVAVLHELLIERVLTPRFGGERDHTSGGVTFKYTADLDEMKRLAGEDPGTRLGVVMRSTPLDAVMAVSLAGEVMPPKSTYFYPKLATGLVVNPLD